MPVAPAQIAEAPDAVAPPAGNPRFPAVDGLRAVAALAIVVFHADQFTRAQNTVLGRVFSHAEVGVTVFFLITGFLLYRPFVAANFGDAPPVTTRLFYWRRLLRIVPAYWLALVVLAPLIIFAQPFGLPNALFLQIYRPAWSLSGIPPAWSVCVEMSFYLLLPAFAACTQRFWARLDRESRQKRELRLLAALAAASIVYRIGLAHLVRNPYAVLPLPGMLTWFCAGMTLAVASVEPTGAARPMHRLAARPWVCWAGASVIYLATLTSARLSATSVSLFVAYALIGFLVLLPIVLGQHTAFAGARFLRTTTAAWLGLVSYGIYLYHYPLEQHLHFHTGSVLGDFLALAVVGVVLAIACGALSYTLVERRVLLLKNPGALARVLRAVRLA